MLVDGGIVEMIGTFPVEVEAADETVGCSSTEVEVAEVTGCSSTEVVAEVICWPPVEEWATKKLVNPSMALVG